MWQIGQPKILVGLINAEVEITATIDNFYHLLTNEKLAPTWLDKVNSTKLLTTLDDHSFVVRTTFEGFAIVSAREMLTKSVLEVKTANRLILKVTDCNDFITPALVAPPLKHLSVSKKAM